MANSDNDQVGYPCYYGRARGRGLRGCQPLFTNSLRHSKGMRLLTVTAALADFQCFLDAFPN
jgi:hypothetical protein